MSVLFHLLGALGDGVIGLVCVALFPLAAPLTSILTLAGPPLPLLLAPLTALAPLALGPLAAVPGVPGCQIPPFQWRY